MYASVLFVVLDCTCLAIWLGVTRTLNELKKKKKTLGEIAYGHWLDLDRLLIQLWESNSTRPGVRYSCTSENEKREAIDCVPYLLPEITKRGIVRLFKRAE